MDTNTEIQKKAPSIIEQFENMLSKQTAEEGQVIIHCIHHPCFAGCLVSHHCSICVDGNIILIPNIGEANATLLYAENILLQPASNPKTELISKFTLVFSALPKNCKTFSFVEPCARGWELHNIKRNSTDVYTISITKSSLKVVL
ncbi:MAG: hypothetical protein CFE25_05625 [Chitinophagaceae bacterium BSSC1]|nr:MAG: hypothetical protein CFE25_05625 [Chitinophagaceae bacterium BSSC1]